jgi:hypothetical protein
MTNYLISFGGTEIGTNRHNNHGIHRSYSEEVQRLFASALPYNLRTLMYDNDWLMQSKYKDCKVLEYSSFSWAFKPISIYETFQKMEFGDNLLWVDSNDILVADPQPIFDISKTNHIYLHDHYPAYYPNRMFTTSRMFVNMECNEEKYWIAPNVQVNILAIYKDEISSKFVDDWLKYAIDWDTMVKNDLPNSPDYIEPRFEQSIASILRVKYDIPVFQGYPYFIAKEENGINVS